MQCNSENETDCQTKETDNTSEKSEKTQISFLDRSIREQSIVCPRTKRISRVFCFSGLLARLNLHRFVFSIDCIRCTCHEESDPNAPNLGRQRSRERERKRIDLDVYSTL